MIIIYSIWRRKFTKVQGGNNKKNFENTKRRLDYKMDNLKKYIKLNNIVQSIKFNNVKKNMELINGKFKKYNPMENLKGRRKYIITACPRCSQKLRLPKGKGKIIVTCSKCCSEFRLKT